MSSSSTTARRFSQSPSPAADATLQRLSRVAWLLDNSIPIPLLGFRVGIDAIIGLIPGVGDAFGVLLSTYLISEAARLRVPRTVLIRMALNVGIDGVVGMIPFFGDVFDAAWKANMRNLRLVRAYIERPRATARASGGFVMMLAIVLIAFMIGGGVCGYLVLMWLLRMLS